MFTAIVEPHVCRAGRSDAPAHPRASRARRPLRHRSGAAVFHVVAGGLEAFAHPGKCRTGQPPPSRSRAFAEIGGQADERGAAMDRGVSQVLGRKL